MKYIMCSRYFPKGHPKEGQPTWFVEKIWKSIWDAHKGSDNPLYPWWEQYDQAFPLWKKGFNVNENIHVHQPKHHTIRAGSRFKPGEIVSLRVWQLPGGRYAKGNKQIEFAQVEVKKVWQVEIAMKQTSPVITINGKLLTYDAGRVLAENDGLSLTDFISWFYVHPKKMQTGFVGQIICWSNEINYIC